nr:hypothetical protein [Tanacetum cinerariifolium]
IFHKFYYKPTNNNLRTSSTSQSANNKQEFVKSDDKQVVKKTNEKKRDVSRDKCYNYKKEGHFAKDCKKAKVKDYEYYKTKMLLTKKDKDEQVFLAEDQAWMESSKKYAKLEAERYEYMIRYSAYFDNDKQHRKQIADQEVLYDKMSVQLVELDKHVRDLKNTVLEKDFKISELEECVCNKDLKIEKCLERLNVCENKIHKMGQTNKTVHMIMPLKDNLYNGRKGIGFENPSYFKKTKDLRPTLYDEKINFKDDYFQEIINLDFEKIDSPFQQTSSLKPYVLNVIPEKIIIDLEDEVVNLLEKEKVNLKKIVSLKSKGFESSEQVSSESKNQSENDRLVVEKNLDTFSSIRRPKNNSVIWKKKGSSNTSNVDLSAVSHSNLNKIAKRYSRKDLLTCNNSHLGETSSAYVCNDAMNVSCNPRLCDVLDDNNFFIFDNKNVRISPVSKMPFKKKPRDSMHIVQICLWIIDSECLKHMTGNRALLTNFVEKFLRTVRFGNNDFAVIAGYGDVVIDGVDLLTGDRSSNLYTIALNKVASNSSTCLLEKASSSQSWLWHQCLSHLNFTTINKLVKNNLVQGLPKMKFEKDHLYSTCKQGKIHQKHRKPKTAFASNKPLYLLHVDLCGSMRVQSINGKRYVLDVVDDYSRRNKTLVEAARTMLTFANLPSFLWAESIATACFTQNHSIIHKHFDKTPYELMNKRKPNIKFFYAFEFRCYLPNNYEDVRKLKAKGDIGVFVGYSKESAAFRIYNKRTCKIHESVNVNFDEISKMASKQFSLEHDLSNLNETRKSLNPSVSQVSKNLKKDLEDLFQDFYDEYFNSSKIMKSSITNVETSINEEVFHEVSESFQGESSSSSLNDDVQ